MQNWSAHLPSPGLLYVGGWQPILPAASVKILEGMLDSFLPYHYQEIPILISKCPELDNYHHHHRFCSGSSHHYRMHGLLQELSPIFSTCCAVLFLT
jgi:hypothetical protein